MDIKKWFRKQAAAISLAVTNVEKSILNQDGKISGNVINQEQRHQQGSLADALMHGEVTQEVKDLRWRTYKVLRESANTKLIADGVDENGNKFYKVVKTDNRNKLRNIKVDTTDDYEVQMVFYNPEITLTISDRLETLQGSDTIDSKSYSVSNKNNVPLVVTRTSLHRFDIEKYAKRLVVRKIDETKRLLEFYISKYGSPENPNSKHFSKELLKLKEGTLIRKDFLEIKEVGFVSNSTIGTMDYLLYQYEIENFEKVIEYDGNYVVKFLAKVLIDGKDILDDFIENDLEERYKNKETKNLKNI